MDDDIVAFAALFAAGDAAYSYEVLRAGVRWPRNVDPTRREEYLTEAEFRKIFRCEFWEYKEYPKWRQLWLKKERDLAKNLVFAG